MSDEKQKLREHLSKTEKLFDLEDESNPLDDISDFEKTIDISGTEEFFLPKLESLNFYHSFH